jgi:uncharacterized membrane protein HdeD (DUF308 family)
MTTNIVANNEKGNRGSLWTGILLIGLGLAAAIAPNFSTIVAETWVAAILISAGAAKLYYAFETREQEGFVWKLLLGLLYVATGIMLLAKPLTGILTLTLLLGSFLLTEGVFELLLAFKLRGKPNWSWVVFNGIVTLVLGLMVLFGWPFNAPWLLGTLVGASIFATGLSRVMLSLNPPPSGQLS